MRTIEEFNETASSPKSKPDEILKALNIQEGDKILEIGVGGGYFANLFSEKIGHKGIYWGIDIDGEFITNLTKLNQDSKTKNINGIKIQPNEIPKIEDKIDLIFTRNSYHHLENRSEYFSFLSKLLSEKGRIAIIDYDNDENNDFLSKSLVKHYTEKSVIKEELNKANCQLKEDFTFLTKQSFLIFEKEL